MTTTNTTPDDGFDFIRKMWSNMGLNMPGMVMPTLDTEELERRITDLKAVEGWLKMNLSTLQMTIQGLEVQRATLAAMKAMSTSASGPDSNGTPNPFANPALWTWPFANAATQSPSPSAPETGSDGSDDADPATETQPKNPRKPNPKK